MEVPPAGSRGRASGGGFGAKPPKGQRFLQILVKFKAYIIGNLRAGGVQDWFSCVGLDRFAPEIKICTILESLEISNSSI